MSLILLILLYLAACVYVADGAVTRGRNGFLWGFLTVWLTPPLAWLIIIALPRVERCPKEIVVHLVIQQGEAVERQP